MLGLARTFVRFFRKLPDRLSKAPVLGILVFFEKVKIVFSKTVARLKELPAMSLRLWGYLPWIWGYNNKRFPSRLE